ncbi:trimethylamine methyltransferase family protein [Algirhabdus cladophorae]|uniref:trimethylamine methyltransferase family protein n=1 Tax=Algirhabdus cladophorae TaxID=3377108 RepID=UPI003B848E56
MTAQPPRRTGRKARQSQAPAPRADYRQLRNPFTPQKAVSDDECQAIHDTALRVLEELGIKVLLPEARTLFAKAGCRVVDDMVYVGRDVVAAAVTTAPKSIRLRAINPAHDQVYELGSLIFTPAGGCPNMFNRRDGRGPGSLAGYQDAAKLTQFYPAMHKMAPSPEPQDVPVHLRHYAMNLTQMTLGDKLAFVYARGQGQVEQTFEMLRLGYGLSDAEFENGSWASTVINTNSPRMLDRPMAQGIIDFARHGQMTIITPFCLAGAMAPITVAGALTLQHAECLAGITLAQITRAGAPVSYGGFASNVDMKSGAPAFGTPEHMKLQLGSGQLARLIGLPWRSAAGSASNAADAQGATENTCGLMGALMAGATMCVHSAGWLEGGLTYGYEKFVTDMEAVQTVAEMCLPTKADAAEIGFDALTEVQPGGHFFAAAHTMERFDRAFYPPLNADLSNHGSWKAAGGQTAEERATQVWQDALAAYTPLAHAGEVAERLAPYIEAKTKAGGAPPMD